MRSTSATTSVNLQYGDVSQDIESFEDKTGLFVEHIPVDFRKHNEELLNALDSVDIVVSVDNSTVFYANMMQKNVIVITPVAAHWIWGSFGSRTPWVPFAQIFRRTPGSEGRDVLRMVQWFINTLN